MRDEFQYRIPLNDAKQLIKLCKEKIVKTRYRSDGFEIDVFHGALQGLIIAEYELIKVREQVYLPKGIQGFEVTNDSRYNNQNLCRRQKVPPLPRRLRSS